MKKRIAVAVGHNVKIPGAVHEESGITEFQFNVELSKFIVNSPSWNSKYEPIPFAWYELISHNKRAEQINRDRPALAIELHCNSYREKEGEKEVSGTEVLYWHTSKHGKMFAEEFSREMASTLGLRNRGALSRKTNNRGWVFLCRTACPALILEPLFIDNSNDFAIGQESMIELADIIIKECCRSMQYMESITRRGAK